MKTQRLNAPSHICLCIAASFVIGLFADVSAQPATLKEAYEDYFLIGVAINRLVAMNDPNAPADNANRTPEQLSKDIELVKKHFNQIVNENDLKPILIHPNPGPDGYNWAPGDAYVQFGIDNDMVICGHTLLWHSQVPDWFFQADPAQAAADQPQTPAPARRGRRGIEGPLASREQLLERMRDHIHAVVGRYKGKVKVWDVVNEALADGGDNILRNTLWTQIIGDDFIAKAFQYAHEADPDAKLRYNDYGLENPAKRERLKKLIKQLQDQNIPVHAIGTQTHINANTTFETMDETLADLASIGLPIHVTELDVNAARGGQRSTDADITGAAERTQGGTISQADLRQSEAYANLFRALIKHADAVEMVTFWGVNDAVSWLRRGSPLLFDEENNPKPAFEAVMKVAKEAKEQ